MYMQCEGVKTVREFEETRKVGSSLMYVSLSCMQRGAWVYCLLVGKAPGRSHLELLD